VISLLHHLDIPLEAGKKIYFASDIHFGEPDVETTRERERRLVRWLEMAGKDAEAIFFVGDIFDFWFEYKHVVPKGCVRFQAKVAELTDNGLPVYVFPGNHDLWIGEYLESELGVRILRDKLELSSCGKRFFVAHGDGLGPGDHLFKLLKKVFTNRFCQWLFRWLHPDVGIKIARSWSRRSRLSHDEEKFLGPEEEWLVLFAKQKLETTHYDYFIFGHRHFAVDIVLNETSRYFNLGDWVANNTYAEFDGSRLQLLQFEHDS
jgi:UDP-2,3-diacylglucosamine hydrolase